MIELPIACTLPPDQMADRVRFIEALAADGLIGQEPIEGGVRSRFAGAPDVERRLRELVAAEQRCCAFLRFEIAREGDVLVLDVTGSQEAQPVIAEFFVAAPDRQGEKWQPPSQTMPSR